MLVLMAAELIMGIVMNYAESAQAFRQGWEGVAKVVAEGMAWSLMCWG